MPKKDKNNELISDNNCLNCRWKEHVEEIGICPAINQLVDLKKPVFDCEKFRKYQGDYYMQQKNVKDF